MTTRSVQHAVQFETIVIIFISWHYGSRNEMKKDGSPWSLRPNPWKRGTRNHEPWNLERHKVIKMTGVADIWDDKCLIHYVTSTRSPCDVAQCKLHCEWYNKWVSKARTIKGIPNVLNVSQSARLFRKSSVFLIIILNLWHNFSNFIRHNSSFIQFHHWVHRNIQKYVIQSGIAIGLPASLDNLEESVRYCTFKYHFFLLDV